MTAEPVTSPRGLASPLRPLVVGDLVEGQPIAGFAWVAPPEDDRYLSTHVDDRLLFDGDEELDAPPDRPVPQTAEYAVPAGVVPPEEPELVRAADTIDGLLPLRFDALLDLPDAPWRPVIRPLVAAVYATGHRLWLAGGAVRDVLAGRPLHEVNDLDLAGTVPPGRFSDIARQVLRVAQMSECRTQVSADSLVCSIKSRRANVRLLEYRGLTRAGFRFPAVGSALGEDARNRDFSFNALMYDIVDRLVYDGSGRGVEDLLGGSVRFRPLRVTDDPFVQAEVVLRGMKFAYRWRNGTALDLAGYREWIAELPDAFWCGFTRTQRASLASLRQQYIPDLAWAAEFATTLPRPGNDFVTSLVGGTR